MKCPFLWQHLFLLIETVFFFIIFLFIGSPNNYFLLIGYILIIALQVITISLASKYKQLSYLLDLLSLFLIILIYETINTPILHVIALLHVSINNEIER